MVKITLATSDSKIWNIEAIIIDIANAMANNNAITIDLLKEGPDLESLELINLLLKLKKQFGYSQIVTILTNNMIQTDVDQCHIVKSPPMHFVRNTRNLLGGADTHKQINKHFGIFIGRSNLHRLYLSSYLYKSYPQKTCQTFHYSVDNDFHRDNLGLTELINCTGFDYVDQAVDFLKLCPMLIDNTVPTYPMLMNQHCDIAQNYYQFFVEVVCETYFSGQTFFPTEKIWRPIAMKTPFIVQGPQYFLHRLRDLGFQTFDSWWTEGYSEDTAGWQPYEIVKILDQLSALSTTDLHTMYQEMLPVLEHNHKTLLSLSAEDFNKISNV
jgi:hypothetical protein